MSDDKKRSSIIPGITLALGVALAAIGTRRVLSMAIPGVARGLSPILLAIVIGLLVGNLIRLPESFKTGIKFCTAKALRLGIILMGIRLSLFAVGRIGAIAVVIVFVCILTGLVMAHFAAAKLKISDRLGTLIAAGTGICGVSAIVATAPAINAKEEETAYAVGTITLYGVIVTLAYPFLSHYIFNHDILRAGLFMGTSIHDTSQVTGAGLIYDQLWLGGDTRPTAADIAITTKMVRNLFLVLVVPMVSFFYAKRSGDLDTQSCKEKCRLAKLFPFFVIGFVLMSLLRTFGDAAFGDAGAWTGYCHLQKEAAVFLLAVALAAAGLGTKLQSLKQLGLRPLLVGMTAAISVAVMSFLMIKLLT